MSDIAPATEQRKLRPEVREKIVQRFDGLMRLAGAASYDEGMHDASVFFERMGQFVSKMKTKDDLRRILDEMPAPSFLEEKLFLGALKYLPQMMRVWARELADLAQRELPVPPPGRPSIDLQEKVRVVSFVLNLYGKAVPLEICKRRAAAHFGISESTVQRIWDDRGSIEEADFRSAMNWISRAE